MVASEAQSCVLHCSKLLNALAIKDATIVHDAAPRSSLEAAAGCTFGFTARGFCKLWLEQASTTPSADALKSRGLLLFTSNCTTVQVLSRECPEYEMWLALLDCESNHASRMLATLTADFLRGLWSSDAIQAVLVRSCSDDALVSGIIASHDSLAERSGALLIHSTMFEVTNSCALSRSADPQLNPNFRNIDLGSNQSLELTVPFHLHDTVCVSGLKSLQQEQQFATGLRIRHSVLVANVLDAAGFEDEFKSTVIKYPLQIELKAWPHRLGGCASNSLDMSMVSTSILLWAPAKLSNQWSLPTVTCLRVQAGFIENAVAFAAGASLYRSLDNQQEACVEEAFDQGMGSPGAKDASACMPAWDARKQVFLKSISGKTIVLSTVPTDTVWHVKQHIATVEGWPVYSQQILLSGKQLFDDVIIASQSTTSVLYMDVSLHMFGGGPMEDWLASLCEELSMHARECVVLLSSETCTQFGWLADSDRVVELSFVIDPVLGMEPGVQQGACIASLSVVDLFEPGAPAPCTIAELCIALNGKISSVLHTVVRNRGIDCRLSLTCSADFTSIRVLLDLEDAAASLSPQQRAQTVIERCCASAQLSRQLAQQPASPPPPLPILPAIQITGVPAIRIPHTDTKRALFATAAYGISVVALANDILAAIWENLETLPDDIHFSTAHEHGGFTFPACTDAAPSDFVLAVLVGSQPDAQRMCDIRSCSLPDALFDAMNSQLKAHHPCFQGLNSFLMEIGRDGQLQLVVRRRLIISCAKPGDCSLQSSLSRCLSGFPDIDATPFSPDELRRASEIFETATQHSAAAEHGSKMIAFLEPYVAEFVRVHAEKLFAQLYPSGCVARSQFDPEHPANRLFREAWPKKDPLRIVLPPEFREPSCMQIHAPLPGEVSENVRPVGFDESTSLFLVKRGDVISDDSVSTGLAAYGCGASASDVWERWGTPAQLKALCASQRDALAALARYFRESDDVVRCEMRDVNLLFPGLVRDSSWYEYSLGKLTQARNAGKRRRDWTLHFACAHALCQPFMGAGIFDKLFDSAGSPKSWSTWDLSMSLPALSALRCFRDALACSASKFSDDRRKEYIKKCMQLRHILIHERGTLINLRAGLAQFGQLASWVSCRSPAVLHRVRQIIDGCASSDVPFPSNIEMDEHFVGRLPQLQHLSQADSNTSFSVMDSVYHDVFMMLYVARGIARHVDALHSRSVVAQSVKREADGGIAYDMSNKWTSFVAEQASLLQAECALLATRVEDITSVDIKFLQIELQFVNELAGRLLRSCDLHPDAVISVAKAIEEKTSAILAQLSSLRSRVGVQESVISQVVSVSGLGGIGKSALVKEYCRQSRLKHTYPDGIFWVNADSLVTLGYGFRQLASQYFGERACADDRVTSIGVVQQKVRGWFSSHSSWLLVIDNLDDASIIGPDHGYSLRSLQAGRIIITSRANKEELLHREAVSDTARILCLDSLNTLESIELLCNARFGEVKSFDEWKCDPRLAGDGCREWDAALAIVSASGLDGLPLALEQAAAYCRELTPSVSFVDYWEKMITSPVPPFIDSDKSRKSVYLTWKLSTDALRKRGELGIAAAECLEILSFMAPDKIPFEIIKYAAEGMCASLRASADTFALVRALPVTAEHVSNCIRMLLRFSLVNNDECSVSLRLEARQSTAYIRVHRLLQAVVRAEVMPSLLDASRRVDIGTHRSRHVLIGAMEGTRRCLKEVWRRKDVDYQLALSGSAILVRHGLALSDCPSVVSNVSYRPIGKTLVALLKLMSDVLVGSSPASSVTLEVSEQLLAHAKCVFGQQLPLHHEIAAALHSCGIVRRSRGEFAMARKLLQDSLEMRETLSQGCSASDAVAESLSSLGLVFQDLGELNTAYGHLLRCLEMCQAINGDSGYPVASAYHNIGQVLLDMGKFRQARTYFEKSLAIKKRMFGDGYSSHPSVATSIDSLGVALQGIGDLRRAQVQFETSLEMRKGIYGAGNQVHRDIAASLSNLGMALHEQGLLERARLKYHECAVMLDALYGIEASRRPVVATNMNRLGSVLLALGDYDGARVQFESSLCAFEGIYGINTPHASVANALRNLADYWYTYALVKQDSSFFEFAFKHVSDSLAMLRTLHPAPDAHPEVVIALNLLGSVLIEQDNLVDAKKVFEDSCVEAVKLGDHPTLAKAAAFEGLALVIHKLAQKFEAQASVDAGSSDSHSKVQAVLSRTPDLKRCRDLLEDSLAIKKSLYGSAAHAEVATTMYHLACLLYDVGYCQKSRQLLLEARSRLREVGHIAMIGSYLDISSFIDVQLEVVQQSIDELPPGDAQAMHDQRRACNLM